MTRFESLPPPQPEQVDELMFLFLNLGKQQRAIIAREYDDSAALFFMPKEVERITDYDEAGRPVEFSSRRFIGKVASDGPVNWRMKVAESHFETVYTDRPSTAGARIYYSFRWAVDRVLDARKIVYLIEDNASTGTPEYTRDLSAFDLDMMLREADRYKDVSTLLFERGHTPAVEDHFFTSLEVRNNQYTTAASLWKQLPSSNEVQH